jgi:hypothetical protein
VRLPRARPVGRTFGTLDPSPAELMVHESKTLAHNPWGDPSSRLVAVYRPPGMATEGLPLVVHLPGFSGAGWLEAAPDRFLGENLFHLFDRLVRAHRVPPAVLVSPDASTRLGGSQYVNSSATGRYADYVAREIVPWARDRFGTEGTAVIGQSSGGFGALHLAMEFPGTFDAVGTSAADLAFEYLFLPEFPKCVRAFHRPGGADAFLRDVFARPGAVRGPFDPSGAALLVLAMSSCYSPRAGHPGEFELPFEPGTGELRSKVWGRWRRFDPVERLRSSRVRHNLRRLRRLVITASTGDEWYLDVAARLYSSRLRSAGIPHRWGEFPGGHFDKAPRFERLFREVLGGAPR